MPEEDRLSIEEALALDDEALLAELGAWLLGDGPGFGLSDFERKLRFAESWLSDQREDFRRQVCGEVRATLKHGGGYDAMIDVATLADAILAVSGKPPANIVAVILLRRGIERLCDDA